jgi:serine/threonine protein kinase
VVYPDLVINYGDFPTVLRAGQLVGAKYVLDRMVGKGGKGVVWAGLDALTGKRVAIKAFQCSFGSKTAERFRWEAMVASRANHPNLAEVLDVVGHGNMTCVVMEMLDGDPLSEYLGRVGPMDMATAAELLLPAMRGVAAANACGIVHRDIKPHNIFLCAGLDGHTVTVKVLDFGYSLLMEHATDRSRETEQIRAVGTLAYMAPEYLQGALQLDSRVDVYSFGVVLFEMLTGHHPFEGPPGCSVLTRILHEPPLPLAELRPDLPQVFFHIVEQALVKDPSQRLASLASFIRLIEGVLLPCACAPRIEAPTDVPVVPVVPVVDSMVRGADPVVQSARHSREDAIRETMMLHTLPSSSAAGTARDSAIRIRLNPTVDEKADHSPDDWAVAETSPPTPSMKKLVGAVLFTAILVFVIWVACPMPSGESRPSVGEPTPGLGFPPNLDGSVPGTGTTEQPNRDLAPQTIEARSATPPIILPQPFPTEETSGRTLGHPFRSAADKVRRRAGSKTGSRSVGNESSNRAGALHPDDF